MKKKMNNKGFSLVELIIVVAIMVLLVGVLAPQYLKFVERSRVSADLDNYQAMISATQVYYADPTNSIPAANTYTLKFKADGSFDSASTEISTAMAASGVKADNVTMKSSTGKGGIIYMIVGSDAKITFEASTDALAAGLGIDKH